MAIITRRDTEKVEVLADGQLQVKEVDVLYDDVADEIVGRKGTHRRTIDVGDSVTAENALIKDIVNGNLHKPARVNRRNSTRVARARARRV